MRSIIAAVILAFGAGIAAQSFELPMPQIPAEMPREQRPAFVVEHFWDALDARDTTLTRSREFMEANSANYFYILPYAASADRRASLSGLIGRLSPDSAATELFMNLVEDYLVEPESPLHNDDLAFEAFEAFNSLPALPATLRDRVHFQHTMLSKNRPGTTAADFEFITPTGEKKTLLSSLSKPTILLFYDPECDHCLHTIDSLRSTPADTAVIAICIEGSRDSWLKFASTLPSHWLSGYDLTDIIAHDLYYIRTLPTLYHLTPEGRIGEKYE